MARSRLIKPGFFTNERLGELPPLTRLLFAGMWTIADKEGRLEDRPKRIKALLLPYDELDGEAAIGELANGPEPLVARYEVNGVRCIQILTWNEHQSPHHKEDASVLPGIDEATTSQPQVIAGSSTAQACGNVEPSLAQASLLVTSNKQQALEKKKRSRRKPAEPDGFAEFYEAYPRRAGRRAAASAYAKAIGRLVDQEDPAAFLLDRARVYAKSDVGRGEQQFIGHPATWLNADSYLDDESSWARGSPSTPTRKSAGQIATENVLAQYEVPDGSGENDHATGGGDRGQLVIRG